VTLRLHMGVERSATDPTSASRRDADLRRSRRTCPPLTLADIAHLADVIVIMRRRDTICW
jgi:hypothetical protein